MDDQRTHREGSSGLRFRKLRIAWSVVWGLGAVLLVVLWVRSYWWIDGIVFYQKCPIGAVCSRCGSIRLGRIDIESVSIAKMGWDAYTTEIDWDTESEDIPSFLWLVDGPNRTLAIPDWFLAAVCGIFAAIPALFRSRWRFTLRTLLIATALVAVVLGLIVWAAK
jgi:hypothetical protein